MPKSILFQLIVNCYMLYRLLETWPAFKRNVGVELTIIMFC